MKQKLLLIVLNILASLKPIFHRLSVGRVSVGAWNIPFSRQSWIYLVKQYWIIAVGILAAVIAFWATQQYARDQVAAERARVLPKGGLIEVLVAARDLSQGDKVSAETLAIRRVPREWSLPNSINPVDFDSVNQMALTRPVLSGHPLTLDHIRQAKSSTSSLQLDPGFRAVSISVDEVSSVGGLIQPGDRVDLWGATVQAPLGELGAMVSLPTDKQNATRPARMIAENLRVIATGQRTQRTESLAQQPIGPAYTSITLAVPAHVAAFVLGGQFQGRLGIALRDASEPSLTRLKLSSAGVAVSTGPVEILIGGLEGVHQ
jgi:pilus assembly protein CpaB